MKSLLPLPRSVRRRPMRTPPPLTHADTAAEGADVLAEVPGPAGVLLWAALRDFMLWVESPAGVRVGLFGGGAGDARRGTLAAAAPEQELWAPLLTLAQMADAPERADTSRLVYAVRAVARWAERAGAPGTRLAFTQAAALALPEDAGLALETGRLARDLGRAAQAETWLRQAVRRARGMQWETYTWAYVGLGVLYVRTGNYPAAQSVFGRALRRARKHRLHALEAVSLHHLFTCAAERKDVAVAYGYAGAALAAYPPRHPRIPALANDLACFWMVLGRYERALPVLEAVIPHIHEETEIPVALASLALAASHTGARATYERARSASACELSLHPGGARAADAWAVLGAADAAAGEWERVRDAASRAHALASARGETEALFRAEALLEAARAGSEDGIRETATEPAVSAPRGHRLAGELLDRIGEMELAGV